MFQTYEEFIADIKLRKKQLTEKRAELESRRDRIKSEIEYTTKVIDGLCSAESGIEDFLKANNQLRVRDAEGRDG